MAWKRLTKDDLRLVLAKEEESKKAKDGFLAWLAARNQKIVAQQKADGGGNEV